MGEIILRQNLDIISSSAIYHILVSSCIFKPRKLLLTENVEFLSLRWTKMSRAFVDDVVVSNRIIGEIEPLKESALRVNNFATNGF